MVKNPLWTIFFSGWDMVGLSSSWEATWEGDETPDVSWHQDQKGTQNWPFWSTWKPGNWYFSIERNPCNLPKSTFSQCFRVVFSCGGFAAESDHVLRWQRCRDRGVPGLEPHGESSTWGSSSCQLKSLARLGSSMKWQNYGTGRFITLWIVQTMYTIIQDTHGPSQFQGWLVNLGQALVDTPWDWMLESARVKCLPNALGSALSTVTHDLHRPSRENHLNLTAKESSPHYEMKWEIQHRF